jgi:phosphoribosylformylglycinamidine synthase
VGLIPDWSKMARAGFAAEGDVILLVGGVHGWGTHMGQSIYLSDLHQRRDGPPPPVDLAAERRAGDFVRPLIRDGVATAVHDLSDGGLGVALAEMAMASGIGATVVAPPNHDPVTAYFGEDQGRYLVTVRGAAEVESVSEEAMAQGISLLAIGHTGGSMLHLGPARPIAVSELKAAHEDWFPRFMAGEL